MRQACVAGNAQRVHKSAAAANTSVFAPHFVASPAVITWLRASFGGAAGQCMGQASRLL
jgi:hypothetical protein